MLSNISHLRQVPLSCDHVIHFTGFIVMADRCTNYKVFFFTLHCCILLRPEGINHKSRLLHGGTFRLYCFLWKCYRFCYVPRPVLVQDNEGMKSIHYSHYICHYGSFHAFIPLTIAESCSNENVQTRTDGKTFAAPSCWC